MRALCGGIHIVADNELEVGESIVAAEGEVVPEKHQRGGVGEGLAEDGEIDSFDARAEGEPTEDVGDQRGDDDDHQRGEPEELEGNPMGRQAAGFGEAFDEFEEDHEVRDVGFVLAELSDHQH